MRSLLLALGPALLAVGCAPPPMGTDDEECREIAQRTSGYRGVPARTDARIEQRLDERWQTFVQAYETCMRARGHEPGARPDEQAERR